tara:strand:- start:673 stop:1380 length:708 start_codon:yes stop_codon:yes gene_type:complete
MTKKEISYSSWPLGRLPKHFHRPELDQLREAGYNWADPRDAISIFEEKVAAYAGCKYAVAVDCCSNGLFLCLKYLKATGIITIPKRTYVSVPMQIMHAGCSVKFEDIEWAGLYQLKPYPVWDAAVRWTKDMFRGGDDTLQVVSFQLKKRVPIGRGGVIMTNNENAYKWLKKASYDGRDLQTNYMEDNFEILGWHMYMTPEDAARGILLMDQTPEVNEDSGAWQNYSDLSQNSIFE